MTDAASCRALFAIFWIAWAVSWIVAARWAAPAAAWARGREVWLYRVVSGVGTALVCSQAFPVLRWQAWLHPSPRLELALALLTIPGFLLTWWARLHLGRLWSAAVTLKSGHEVIDTGPYAWVRHPIYTGILEAALVSAIAGGTAVSALGFAVLALGFWIKARLEESFLATELGPERYRRYREEVPMLLPWRLPRPR